MDKKEYRYEAIGLYDELYRVRIELDSLEKLLNSSERINKDRRLALLDCIHVIKNLERC